MFKKITCVAAAVLLCCSVFVSPMSVNAAGVSNSTKFSVSYPEPYTSDTRGYFSVIYTDNVNYYLNTYIWSFDNITNTDTNVDVTTMDIQVTGNSVKFMPYLWGQSLESFVSIYCFNSDDSLTREFFELVGKGDGKNYQYTYSGYSIVGYVFNGNVGSINSSLTHVNVPNILWNDKVDSETLYSHLDDIYDEIGDTNVALSDIYSKLDEILQEDKTQNSWLEKIFNYLNESKDKEKEEATTQGSSSVSQGEAAIEDKGAGFTNSLNGLVSSMSYTGTEAAWKFPSIKLPAIPGVMDEIKLTDELPIDFSQWVSAIPSGILLLIQSICTIGLIVYCFKELYSTIAYVLTLRKDDNS